MSTQSVTPMGAAGGCRYPNQICVLVEPQTHLLGEKNAVSIFFCILAVGFFFHILKLKDPLLLFGKSSSYSGSSRFFLTI